MIRKYKVGEDRKALNWFPGSLDEVVEADHPVRAIEAYVEMLDLTTLGFQRMEPNATAAGQPAFPPGSLLKLYLYGYLNRVRSSRALAKECQRNLEVIWLMQGLRPSYRTIADFRQANAEALRRVHVEFVALCREWRLLGGERVGVDGSHFHGNVSDQSFRSVKRLAQEIDDLAPHIDEHLKALAVADAEGVELPSQVPDLPAQRETLKALTALKEAKEALRSTLAAAGETQVSMTDPEARLLNKRGHTTAGYNVQIVVDSQHHLMVTDAVVQDGNDTQQLYPMLSQAKAALGVERLDGLGDCGYYHLEQIAQWEAEGIPVYVPEPSRSARQRQEGRHTPNDFRYSEEEDVYRLDASHPDFKYSHLKTGSPRSQKRKGSTALRKKWRGYKGPPESSGRGMQEEKRRRTRETPGGSRRGDRTGRIDSR
jgi:transposase